MVGQWLRSSYDEYRWGRVCSECQVRISEEGREWQSCLLCGNNVCVQCLMPDWIEGEASLPVCSYPTCNELGTIVSYTHTRQLRYGLLFCTHTYDEHFVLPKILVFGRRNFALSCLFRFRTHVFVLWNHGVAFGIKTHFHTQSWPTTFTTHAYNYIVIFVLWFVWWKASQR